MVDKVFSYLRHGRLMQVQLQLLDEFHEVCSLEDDRVLRYPVAERVLAAVNSFEDACKTKRNQ